MLASILIPLLLIQTPVPAAAPVPAPAEDAGPISDAQASALAAQRAAEAAQKAAEAAQKAAEAAVAMAAALRPPAAPPACVAPPAPPAPPPPPYAATVSLGLISLTGNTESVNFTGNAAGSYKLGEWILSSKLSGSYGESRATPGAPEVPLAEAGMFQLRADRKFTQLIAVFAYAEGDTDHIKSLEYRALGEAGVSLYWWDTRRPDGGVTYLRTDVGLRYAYDSRFQYLPTPQALPAVTLVGPDLGVEFHYGITADLLFTQTADVVTNVDGATRTMVASLSKLSVRFLGNLAIGASFGLNYDSAPAAGKLPTDTALALTLDYKT